MMLFSNHWEPGRKILAYPTRRELTETIDTFLSASKDVRFSSIPVERGVRAIRVLWGDTFEYWQKADSEPLGWGLIGKLPLKWKTRFLRRTLRRYRSLFILTIESGKMREA